MEKKEIERLENELREATALNRKHNQDIARLRDISATRDNDNRAFQGKIAQMDQEIASNNQRFEYLQEVREQKEKEHC